MLVRWCEEGRDPFESGSYDGQWLSVSTITVLGMYSPYTRHGNHIRLNPCPPGTHTHTHTLPLFYSGSSLHRAPSIQRKRSTLVHELELVSLHCAIHIEPAAKVPIGRRAFAQASPNAWHTKWAKHELKINKSFSHWRRR